MPIHSGFCRQCNRDTPLFQLPRIAQQQGRPMQFDWACSHCRSREVS